MDWREQAACRGVAKENYDVFFPEYAGDTYGGLWSRARKFCAECPVTAQCLADALDNELGLRTRNGMWGGKTPKERDYESRVAVRLRM